MNKLHDEITRAFEDAAREAEITEPGRYYRHAIAIAAAIRELARTRLLEIAAMREGEWRPIEMAPKDGTRLLGYGEHTERGHYIDEIHFWGGRWTIEWMAGYRAPTHWQPLPPPPSPATATSSLSSQ